MNLMNISYTRSIQTFKEPLCYENEAANKSFNNKYQITLTLQADTSEGRVNQEEVTALKLVTSSLSHSRKEDITLDLCLNTRKVCLNVTFIFQGPRD